MNILIFNTSGSVGKSFIAREVFAARIPNHHLIEVEGRNAGNAGFSHCFDKYTKVNIAQKKEEEAEVALFGEVLTENNIIVDLGASNSSEFLLRIEERMGFVLNRFDMIIVPLTPDPKTITDSIQTFETLDRMFTSGIELGIEDFPPVYAIPNKVEHGDFSFMEKIAKEIIIDFVFTTSTRYGIADSATYTALVSVKKTLKELAADTTDYIAKKKAEKDPVKKTEYMKMEMLRAQSIQGVRLLDNVFDAIMEDHAKIVEGKKKKEEAAAEN